MEIAEFEIVRYQQWSEEGRKKGLNKSEDEAKTDQFQVKYYFSNKIYSVQYLSFFK